jgi:hypothetical protein
MPATERRTTEWRDAAAYAPLLQADRSILAWEWLRRNAQYRQAAAAAGPAAERQRENPAALRWGLHAFVDPAVPAPEARPLWTARLHPYVLFATTCVHGPERDLFDIGRFSEAATLVDGSGGGEHLLLSNGYHTLRVDLISGSLKEGPVKLRYLIGGFASAEKPLLTLQRLLRLSRTCRFASDRRAPERTARRLVLVLRASDALAAGANQREIAAVLLGREARGARWRAETPSLRSGAQRLVRAARRMASGAYLDLLK